MVSQITVPDVNGSTSCAEVELVVQSRTHKTDIEGLEFCL